MVFFDNVLGTFTLYSFNEQSTIYWQVSLYFIFKGTFYFSLQRTQHSYYLCKGTVELNLALQVATDDFLYGLYFAEFIAVFRVITVKNYIYLLDIIWH